MSSTLRGGAVVALLVVSVLTTAMLRELAVGRAEVAAADDAAAKGHWAEAVAHARAAAEARSPGSPWPARGLSRLQALGHEAEVRGDDGLALLSYGALRSAAISTRTATDSNRAWFDAAAEGLTRVGARQRGSSERASTQPREEPPVTWPLVALAVSVTIMLCGLARLAWPGRGERIALAGVVLGFAGYAVVLLTT